MPFRFIQPSLRTLVPALTLSALLGAGPAEAQSTSSRIDQPTPGTLPPGTSTVQGRTAEQEGGSGRISPPSKIRSSTDVMKPDGASDGRGAGQRTDPVEHLPKNMR